MMARGFFVISLLALLLAGCSASEPLTLPIKGKSMPRLQLTNLDGETFSSHKVFADKVVILNVWATWCPPCRQEMPDLIRLSEMLPRDKFLVAGLAADNNAEDVRAYIEQQKIPFPIYWDKGGKAIAAEKLGVFKYPETFIINRYGIFVEKVVGAFPWADPQMVEVLNGIYNTGKVPAARK